MLFIKKPFFTIKDTYPVCVNFVSDPAIKGYLKSLQSEVEQYSERYEELASAGKLNEFVVPDIFDPEINSYNNWLKNLYKYYLSVKSKPSYAEAYKFYSLIKNYETYDKIRRCAYCNNSMVQALDHFLPESVFKALAVNPINLIPSCDNCNETKSTYKPIFSKENSVLIHPYFDNIFDIKWLKVRVKIIHIFKINPKSIENIKNFKFIYDCGSSSINIVDVRSLKYIKKMIHTVFYINPEICESNKLLFERINLTFEKTGLNTTFSFAANDFFQTELVPNFLYGEYSDKSDEDLRVLFAMKGKILCRQGYNENHWKITLYNFLSKYQCGFKDFY